MSRRPQCEGAMLVDEMMKRNVPDFPAQPIVAVIDDYQTITIAIQAKRA